MEKRFQVFISSTFTDLKDERQAVLRAVLELDHMPAGMELFPASDDAAWQLITDVIDASDYYVLIIGGRYGSLDETGLGYTEKEYDYALSSKKPVIPLLHQNPDNLPRDKTDTDPNAWERLKAFRAKVAKRHTCVYWNTVEDLKARVIIGLTAALKRNPAIGWVRADRVPSEASLAEVLGLRTRLSELEAEREAERTAAPKGTEELLQGDETFQVDFDFTSTGATAAFIPGDTEWSHSWINPTWDQIFGAVAPCMINEASDDVLRDSFRSFFESVCRAELEGDKDLEGRELSRFEFQNDQIDTCIIQLRALNLITGSERKRRLGDTETYWTLTPYGDYRMVQLRAVRRMPT